MTDDHPRGPVAVLGAGTLGRRIALVLAAGGTDVRLHARRPEAGVEATAYVAEQVGPLAARLGQDVPGRVTTYADLAGTVEGAWLVVESLPEDLALKRRVLAELDTLVGPEVVLATNSSSFPSRELADVVSRPERLLNTHFQMPPTMMSVELMSCGQTDPAVVTVVTSFLEGHGLAPFLVQRESVGFLFNRVWAAIKRESLMILEEGVSTPEELDRIFRLSLGTAHGPCRLMDQVGLDVVLAIEEHYAQVRDGLPEGPRRLLREHVARGDLGVKTGRGLLEHPAD
ncbi:MAG: 3-hydroxybutyryl-CoA dehydrogenase [Marmoricola sp.]|nr:3-hydroxybutyryl-CoA dehydrogenase [Marmoricola sp.]